MSAFDFDPDDLDEDDLDAFAELSDEDLAELFEDAPDPDTEPGLLLLGCARPATRRPTWVDPQRTVDVVLPIDDYTPPARTETRNR